MKRVLLRLLRAAKGGLDGGFGPLLQRWRRAGPPDLRPYCGFGTPHAVTVQGRVLRPYGLARGRASDPAWLNLTRVLLRLFSREISNVDVQGRLGTAEAQATTDREGFFELRFVLEEPLPGGWTEAEITLPGHAEGDTVPVRVVGDAEVGIISDLDDTVIRTGVTSWWQMLDTVLLENARTRLPFAGAGELYRALVRGPGGQGDNPVFYVSSSPWNFYSLLWRFLKKRDVPLGPFFLRDWSLRMLDGTHGSHKLDAIERLMGTYPDLPFVLIGDSGQEDPEIYREAVRRFPGRVRAVYIRDVTGKRRHAEVVKVRGAMQEAGVDLRLIRDSLAAAQHAQASGLIASGALARIADGVADDRAARGRH